MKYGGPLQRITWANALFKPPVLIVIPTLIAICSVTLRLTVFTAGLNLSNSELSSDAQPVFRWDIPGCSASVFRLANLEKSMLFPFFLCFSSVHTFLGSSARVTATLRTTANLETISPMMETTNVSDQGNARVTFRQMEQVEGRHSAYHRTGDRPVPRASFEV